MAAGDMTPEREEQVMADLLREQVGIDPGKVGPLVDLAAIGLVNGAWRNTCVENWHAAGRMRDGDMLRVNSHTTWRWKTGATAWAARRAGNPGAGWRVPTRRRTPRRTARLSPSRRSAGCRGTRPARRSS
jgi:hypothetical protein